MKRTNLKNYTFCVHESHLLRAITGETVVEKMAFQGGHQKASFQVYTLASYHKGLWINSTFRSMGILLEKKLYRATGSITIPLILSRFTQRKSATFLQSHQCLSFFFFNTFNFFRTVLDLEKNCKANAETCHIPHTQSPILISYISMAHLL